MSYRIIVGDCRTALAGLPSESVHCVVTSPPYYGLRDYGVDGQIGLEETPDAYVAEMVSVFREVRRVLRADGTLWLNIGDSYSAHAGQRKTTDKAEIKQQSNTASVGAPSRCADNCKPKDLIGIPWALAFALRADGWYLRQEIIWHKLNPMPESVTDRCTKAHESLFLLTKSATYFYDAEAIKEASVTEDPRRPYTSEGAWVLDGRPIEQRHGGEPRSYNGSHFNTGKTAVHQLNRSSSKPRTAGNKSHKYVEAYEASDTEERRTKAGLMKVADVPWASRNKRSVWSIATAPYAEAHFAVYPSALVEPCILAGTSEHGVCARCGAPWERQIETKRRGYLADGDRPAAEVRNVSASSALRGNGRDAWNETETLGWLPTCACAAGDPVPATVLDPFIGSGTTAVVAERLGRNSIGIELSPEYAAMAERRIESDQTYAFRAVAAGDQRHSLSIRFGKKANGAGRGTLL